MIILLTLLSNFDCKFVFMNLKKISIFTIAVLSLTSCTNDSTSDLTDPVDEEITYNNHVKSIIDNNCLSCHGTVQQNGAPMSLVTYENVREAVLNRGLMDRISRETGEEGLMPFGGQRLPQTTIDQIVQWQVNGFQQ